MRIAFVAIVVLLAIGLMACGGTTTTATGTDDVEQSIDASLTEIDQAQMEFDTSDMNSLDQDLAFE